MSIKKFATLVFAGMVALSSCGESDTIIEVQILGNVGRIVQLDVDLSIGADKRNFKVPGAAQTISLPTSFTVQVSPDLQGPVSITIRALDDAGKVIVEKKEENILAKLSKGQVNRVVVALTGGVLIADGGMMMINRDGGVVMMTGDAGIPDGSTTMDGAVATPDASVNMPDAAVVMPDAAVVMPDAELPMPDADETMDAAEVDAPE
jgi:hypothetical protein